MRARVGRCRRDRVGRDRERRCLVYPRVVLGGAGGGTGQSAAHVAIAIKLVAVVVVGCGRLEAIVVVGRRVEKAGGGRGGLVLLLDVGYGRGEVGHARRRELGAARRRCRQAAALAGAAVRWKQ